MEPEQMRVAFVLWSGEIAGAENHVIGLATHIKESYVNIQPHTCILSSSTHLKQALKKRGLCTYEFGFNHVWNPVAIIRLGVHFRKNRYNVIHIHAVNPIIALLIRFFSSAPLICTRHGSFLKPGFINTMLMRIASKIFRLAIYVSESQRKKFRNVFGIREKKSMVIPPAIDISRYHMHFDKREAKVAQGFAEHDIVIGYVGRFEKFKQIPILIDAFGTLGDSERNLRLVIVGFGKQEEEIRAAVNARGIKKRTKIVIQPDDVLSLQRSIDILVHPSQHESFGLSVVEAMALGQTVVVNKFESAGEIVEHGVDGYVINDIDLVKLSKQLHELVQNPEKMNAVGKKASEKVLVKYDSKTIFDQIVTLYSTFSLPN